MYYRIRRRSPSPADDRGDTPFTFPLSTTTVTDNPVEHNPAMSSSQPHVVAPILASGDDEESVLNMLQQSTASENLGNLTASARTSRTRVDQLPNSPPREITTAAPSIQDEGGDAPPAQEPPREEARAEPMVSLTILVLSGDRKKFTFHPETTAGRVKEMIWSTWDASTPPVSPRCTLRTSDKIILHPRLDEGYHTPQSIISPSPVHGEDTARRRYSTE